MFTEIPWTTLEVFTFVAQLLACVAASLFPLLFGLRAPWWKSALGKAQLFSSVVLALALWVSAGFRLLRHADIYVTETTGYWIFLILFLAIAVAKVCLTLVMLRIQGTSERGYRKDHERA